MSHADVQAEKAVIGAVLCGATRAQVEDLQPSDLTEARAEKEAKSMQGKAVSLFKGPFQ
jgi:hypothetical protein